ncbi:MAG: DUF1957 domain-containing protein, partial [Nitrospinota bacterium]|nr:DUF1957 domain-containing protein [Nitrospinota bacterium]
LDQAARELMLAQSSDWPFMMKTGAMSGFAAKRVEEHLANFNKLREQVAYGKIDTEFLLSLEQTHCLLKEEDFSVFAQKGY